MRQVTFTEAEYSFLFTVVMGDRKRMKEMGKDFDDMYQDIINQLKKGELIEDWDCDFYEED